MIAGRVASGRRPGRNVQSLGARRRVIRERLAGDYVAPGGGRACAIAGRRPRPAAPVLGGRRLARSRIEPNEGIEPHRRLTVIAFDEGDQSGAKARVIGAGAGRIRTIERLKVSVRLIVAPVVRGKVSQQIERRRRTRGIAAILIGDGAQRTSRRRAIAA